MSLQAELWIVCDEPGCNADVAAVQKVIGFGKGSISEHQVFMAAKKVDSGWRALQQGWTTLHFCPKHTEGKEGLI